MTNEREASTTLEEILLRVVDRLVDQVTEAKEANTFISTTPMDTYPSPAEFLFEVSPSENWSFDQGHITGAGKDALHAVGSIKVTIHSMVQRDQTGKDVVYLTNATSGILRLVTAVLDALSDHDLLDEDDGKLLSDPMRPTDIAIPPKDDRTKGWVTILFAVEFDWAMTRETFVPEI